MHWVKDVNLINAHIDIANISVGKGLEMCCGTAVLANAFKAKGWQMTGVDISPCMVELASKRINAIQGNVENLIFQIIRLIL